MYLSTPITHPPLDPVTFPQSRHWDSIRVRFVLESDRDRTWQWELVDCVPPPDRIEHVEHEEETIHWQRQRYINANLWLLARGRWDAAGRETVSIIQVHGHKSFTLVIRSRAQGTWSATAKIALLEPPEDGRSGFCSAVDQFGALVAGKVQPTLHEVTGHDGVMAGPLKLSLPSGQLSALFIWSYGAGFYTAPEYCANSSGPGRILGQALHMVVTDNRAFSRPVPLSHDDFGNASTATKFVS